MKNESATDKLVERVNWLATLFRGLALFLMIFGFMLPALGTWLLGNNFGYTCWCLMGVGLLFALGCFYLRAILREYERNKDTNKEG